MRLRLGEEPWGAARFAWAYLAALVAAVVGALLAAIVYPLIEAAPLCRGDALGLCLPAVSFLVGLAGVVLGLFLVAYCLRLGWLWAGWFAGLTMLLGQFIVQIDQVSLVWLALLIPAAATAVTFERPNADWPRWWLIARVGVLVCLLGQFLVWMVLLLTQAS